MVAVWRNDWLPSSETFIRDHLSALRRWQPMPLGLRRLEDGLNLRPYRAPFALRGWGRIAWAVERRVGYLGAYDATLLRHRPMLVHAHFGPDAVEVMPIARRHRLPLVVTFHGYDLTAKLRSPSGPRYRTQLGELFDYADLLLPVSHELERRLLALGAPAGKVRTHYLGLQLSEPLPQPGGDRAGIVYVGRLIALKAVADLIEAVRRLPAALRQQTPVTIIGGGPERARLEAQAASIPEMTVRFLGTQPSDVVATELRQAAVLCAPSRAVQEGDVEAFGLVFLEAARAGTPAVGYRHGGVVEAVVDGVTGLLAPEGDLAGLAARLARLLEDRALASRLGAAGQRRVVQDFDLAKRTELLETYYDAVAARRPLPVAAG